MYDFLIKSDSEEESNEQEIDLSVVIVNYNVKYFLEQCLHSLKAATVGMYGVEIFVVDNNSTDGSVEYLKAKYPDVIFLENKENVGFARANNQAFKQCKGKYVLMLNPDTVVGEESLRSLIFHMDDNPEIGAVGFKMIDGNGRFLAESKRSFPTPWVSFCKLSGLSKLFPMSPKYASYSLPYLSADEAHEVEVLAGAFMFMRREALEKAGGLDERYFMYGEDIDLSYQIVKAGYKNYYIPERLLHYKGESTKHGDMSFVKRFYGAMLLFYKKYYPEQKLFGSFIRVGIYFYGGLAAVARVLGLYRRKKVKHKRMMIISGEEYFEETKKAALKSMPSLSQIKLWNLNENRTMNAIGRSINMHRFTDITFVWPDVRYEQMLLYMDQMPSKNMTYHIYNAETKLYVSPGE